MNMNPDQFQQQYPAPGNPYIPSDPYALRVGFGKRLGAVAIDFIIVIIISVIAGLAAGSALMGTFGPSGTEMEQIEGMTEQTMSIAIAAGGIVIAFYLVSFIYSLVELFTGASPAKHIFGIVIAREDREPRNFTINIIRWALKYSGIIVSVITMLTGIQALSYLGIICFIITFIGCFFVLGEKKQALHDMLAKTAIFHKEDVIEAGSVTAGTTV